MSARVTTAGRAVAIMLGLASAVIPATAAAQEPGYTLETSALYRVDPQGGVIAVTVDATFTHQTPDPPGQIAIFPEALLAVHPGATDVAARDTAGDLAVTTEMSGDTNVATVTLREPIRFGQTAVFTVEYTLVDEAAVGIRVRPSATVFPAWGFGTTSAITVELPAGYRVSVRGDPLETATGPEIITLTSGPITAPAGWVAIITADRDAEFVTVQRSVPLASGTADLRVEAWTDDEAWGRRTLDLFAESLPIIERTIGLPYEHAGPLIVTESVSRSETGFDGEQSAGILLGFDQPPFTALHEAAHIWIGPNLFDARWIYEGFASHFANVAGSEIGVAPPYDARATMEEHAGQAFPLDEWREADAGSERDAYGYPASWTVAATIAERAGDEAIREILAAIAAEASPYASLLSADAAGRTALRDVDSRGLLDHLEQSTATAFEDLFAADVFTSETAAQLPTRAAARAAAVELHAAAGAWGVPAPVLDALEGWDFAVAQRRISAAREWLGERDTLTTDLATSGLRAPATLESWYVEHAGLDEGRAELDDVRSFLDAYRTARSLIGREASFVEQVGLLGAPDHEAALADGARQLAAGDIESASGTVDGVVDRLDGAEADGWLRLAATGVVAVGLPIIGLARVANRRAAA